MLPLTVANALTLYVGSATGQVFTKPGEGRVEFNYAPDVQEAAQTPASEGAESKAARLIFIDAII